MIWILLSLLKKFAFDMSFTDFANKMLNGLTTDYAAYEAIQKYKKFVMTQFFK